MEVLYNDGYQYPQYKYNYFWCIDGEIEAYVEVAQGQWKSQEETLGLFRGSAYLATCLP